MLTTALQTNERLTAHTGLLASAIIVGFSFPAVGLLHPDLPPLLLTALRFGIAALVLWPWASKHKSRLPHVHSLPLYMLSGLCMAGFFGAMFWAAHRSSAVIMSTLFVSAPLISYATGRWLGVEPRTRSMLWILLLGATGALTLIWADAFGRGETLRMGVGELVFFLGCISSAVAPVITKWGLNHRLLPQAAEVRTFWSLIAGGLLIAALGLLIENPKNLLFMRGSDVVLLIYLGVFSSGLTFWLGQYATALLTPAAVKAYGYLAPFTAMILLFINQPQQMSWHWLPGSLLILLTMTLLLLRDARRNSPSISLPHKSYAASQFNS